MSWRRKRGRKGEPKKKKKWQLELSSEDDDAAGAVKAEADGDEIELGESYKCKECNGDNVVLSCITCTGTSKNPVYYTKKCFVKLHAETKDTTECKMSDHQYRLLMGENSDQLGIFVGQEVTAKGQVIKRKLARADREDGNDEDNPPAKKAKGKEFAWMSSSSDEEEEKPAEPQFDPLTRDARSVYIAGLQSNIPSTTVRKLFASQGLSIVRLPATHNPVLLVFLTTPHGQWTVRLILQ